MHVFIAGANGQIGQHLLREMADSDHEARAMVRHQDQGPELQQLGATETVLGDLEHDCSEAMRGCDVVIFTAGSGPHTGPDKTIDVDQDVARVLVVLDSDTTTNRVFDVVSGDTPVAAAISSV